MAAYHDRFKHEYGSVEKLNARWNLNLFSQAYDRFEQVPGDWGAWHNPHLKYEWSASHYDSDIAFIHRQADILRQYTAAPIGTDMMPLNGMDYEKMNGALDVVMFNHYNTPENLNEAVFWFDFIRTLKDRPFWNTETCTGQVLKPEGYCRVNSWLPVALGGECNMYWLWRQHWAGHELVHGSVISPEGRPTHTFGEVIRTAAEFADASGFLSGSRVVTPVALHFTSKSWQLSDHQPVVEGNSYLKNVQSVHRALTRCGVRPDVIGAMHPLDDYKLLVSPCVMTLEDGNMAQRICAFVENGGIWVAGPMTDIRNGIGSHYTDKAMGMIEDWLGVRLDYGIPTDGTVLQTAWKNGEKLSIKNWAELFTVNEGECLAFASGGHSALTGKSLVSRHKVGKGEVILCGALPEDDDLDKLLAIALSDASVEPFSVSGELQIIPRAGETEGIVLCETGCKPASLCIGQPMTDLLTGETFRDTVCVEPYGVRVLIKSGQTA